MVARPDLPISERVRALCSLRNLNGPGPRNALLSDEHSVALLEEFAGDPEPIVSQSCEVALTMLEYEQLGKSFEYLFMQTLVMQL
ncbi:deoxyhypusine hydroxylase-like [Mangifera indica]|uniref:deoxyhypusine hydroxylase-like n=1 Tax=Mangifera indica TaxID=29780 RepID=UPI001CFA908D|nr:deoxyhypusine hydroxylase-like [Mangifera indica]